MCDGKNSQLLCGDLIDDVVGEPTEDISPTGATKYSTEQRIGQNEIGCSFKLSHKCETQPDIRFQRIECAVSCSSASADGATTSFTSAMHVPVQVHQQLE